MKSLTEKRILLADALHLLAFVAACAAWLNPVGFGPVPLMGLHLASGIAVALAVGLHSRATQTLQTTLRVAGFVSAIYAIAQVAGFACLNWSSRALCPSGEAHAFLGQRNLLASLLVCSLWAFLLRPAENTASSAKRIGSAVAICVISAATALTLSRTGFLALIASGIALWHYSLATGSRTSVRRDFFLVSLSYLVAAGVDRFGQWYSRADGANLLGRFVDPESYSRIALWGNVIELIAQSPWVGHGWRSLAYLHFSTDFTGPRFMEMLDNAHNLPLHLAVELGLPFALVFCVLVGWVTWRARPWAETRWDRQMAWGVLLVIGIHSMVEYPLWYGPFFMTTLVVVGFLSADSWQKWKTTKAASTQRAVGWGLNAFAVLIFVCVIFVACDYHRASQIYLQPEKRSRAYADDPMAAARKSVLFQSHAKFAELQITPLTKDSAARVFDLSSELVRWSPEPRIIEKLIESATMLGNDDIARFYLRRYRIAYPAAYSNWSKLNRAN